jgi:hypothetical protein
MRPFIAATIFLAATSIALGAAVQLPQFPKDEPYAKARKILLKKGWKVVHEPEKGFVCDKGDPRCKGRPETVACAGTGAANCIFRWKRKGVVVDVNTVGETEPVVTDVTCHSGCA